MASTTYQQILARGAKLGAERGEKRGEKRGLKLGQKLGEERGERRGLDHLRAAILDLVRCKLGRSPRGLAARLAAIEEPEQLRALTVALGRARTRAEVAAALAGASGSP